MASDITGNASNPDPSAKRCAFAERNAYAMRIDYEKEPPVFQVTDTHYAATWLLDERAPKVKAPIGERRYGK